MATHRISSRILQHKLGILRNEATGAEEFRRVLGEISVHLFSEALNDLPAITESIATPIAETDIESIHSSVALISIMRAGNCMLDSVLGYWPDASVGHFGIYRDKIIDNTVEYYFKMPQSVAEATVFLLDPVIATGETANACVLRMKEIGCKDIRFISILASAQGVATLERNHPDVQLYTMDTMDDLNSDGFLTPGVGDINARFYSTQVNRKDWNHAVRIRGSYQRVVNAVIKSQIIAVAGGSCSGKTTMVRKLHQYLGSELSGVLYQDSYYRGLADISNFDHPDAIDFELMRDHLELLKQGVEVEMPVYDFETHRRVEETQQLTPKPVILVDGILILQSDALREVFDFSVFLECDEETRKQRRLDRDVLERGRTRESTLEQFLTQVAPLHNTYVDPSKHHADVILPQINSWAQLDAPALQVFDHCEKLAGIR